MPPRHPGLPVVCRYFIFSCSRSPSCCCTLPHTLLHTTQHNTTQHNTTRWVLRAAANTCLHTMPCAAGELCQLSDNTTTPEFSCCGPCRGRLHRIYGDPDDDEEVNRICEPFAAAKKSTSSTNDHSNAAKRKEGGGNNTVVAGYHDSRRNTDTPYRSLWRYICSSCARAGVFPGIPACTGCPYTGTCPCTGLPVCPVYRFFLVLPLQAGKSGHRLYTHRDVLCKRSLVLFFGRFLVRTMVTRTQIFVMTNSN